MSRWACLFTFHLDEKLCCVQVPSEAQKMPWRLWQRMRDFEKPLNDNKCPTRPLQANSGHCGIVVYTYRAVQAVL